MTYNERNEILMTDEFIGKIRIALCDWLNYWAINGTSSIEDLDLKFKTDSFINSTLSNLEAIVKRISILAISDPSIKNAIEITDTNVETAIVNILSHSLDYLI